MRFPLTARHGLPTAALLALVAPLMASTPAEAASAGRLQDSERGRIVTLHDKCLDVRGGDSDDGTPVIQYRCRGTANQRFRLVSTDRGRYQIRTLHNKCLDVSGASSADGTSLIQYRCRGTANQKFWLRPVGSGRYEMRTLHDKCLDVHGQSASNGAPVIQYRCHGTANQRFRFERV
ncbi:MULTISPECIES: RICIN domain-containing protein [Actinomadura]|uniref:Ricin B lectin domain-containing protein n=1 Tax=Actinomadura miaoliensis TaxID=430685 RepID=A0ABP7X7G4_9ACTN